MINSSNCELISQRYSVFSHILFCNACFVSDVNLKKMTVQFECMVLFFIGLIRFFQYLSIWFM